MLMKPSRAMRLTARAMATSLSVAFSTRRRHRYDNGMTDFLSMSSALPPLAPRQLDGDPERPGLRYPRTQVVTSSGVSYCGSSAAGKTRPAADDPQYETPDD